MQQARYYIAVRLLMISYISVRWCLVYCIWDHLPILLLLLQASCLLWVRCFQLCKNRISVCIEISLCSFNMSPKNCYNDCWSRFDTERDTVFVKVVLRYKVNEFSLYDICEHWLKIMQNYKYYIEYWTVCVLKLCKILIAVRQSACLIGVFICLWVCLSWNATCLRCVCRPYCAECLCLSLL